MKKLSIKLLPLVLMAFVLVSCEKNDTSLNGAGNTINKIVNGGADPTVLALDYKEELQEIVVLDVRRDIPNSTELMKEATITITNTQEILDAFNADNETAFEVMPVATYQVVSNPNLTVSADRKTWTVKFAPGEYVTQIKVKVDATEFDLSASYAFGFKISNVTQGETHGDLGSAIINVLIKNKYEGEYVSEGFFYHPSSPRAISEDKYVYTAGATTVLIATGDLGGAGYYAYVTVNEATNKLTITSAIPLTYYQLDSGLPTTNPGYTPQWTGSSLCNNTYDPKTGTFYLRYGYVGGTGYRVAEEIISPK